MTTNNKIVDRIKKLLNLAQSPNMHEAEAAAAEVQRLMTEHQISDTDLSAGPSPIVRTVVQERTKSRAETWRGCLAVVLGKHLHVMPVGMGGDAMDVIGRETDVAAFCLLFHHLARHLDRLAAAAWYAIPHSQRAHENAHNGGMLRWVNTFHMGARREIDRRMTDQKALVAQGAAVGASTALVRMETYGRETIAAIVKFNRDSGARIGGERKVRIASAGESAEAAGRRAGGSVSLSPSARALPGRR